MQHPHEVDMVRAVLGSHKIVVYGENLLRQRVVDGETTRATVAAMPIGRPESAEVLKVSFAQCGNVTWAKVLDAGQQILGMERAMAADPRLNQE